MPIVVSRHTGEIISKPEYTQADYDRAWDVIAKAWAKKHREELRPAPCTELGRPDRQEAEDKSLATGQLLSPPQFRFYQFRR